MRVHLRRTVQERRWLLEHHDRGEAVPGAAELGAATEPALSQELSRLASDRKAQRPRNNPGPLCFQCASLSEGCYRIGNGYQPGPHLKWNWTPSRAPDAEAIVFLVAGSFRLQLSGRNPRASVMD